MSMTIEAGRAFAETLERAAKGDTPEDADGPEDE
jgi:hypothetical protein